MHQTSAADQVTTALIACKHDVNINRNPPKRARCFQNDQ